MFLSANEANHKVWLADGNGKRIENCIEIETNTGEALVFMDLDRPEAWPEHWSFGEFLGVGGAMKVKAVFKTPITVTMQSGVAVQNELQLAVANRFESLGLKIDSKSKQHKQRIEDAFVNLWAELGRAKAGIFDT
jgi:hypothetical protein